MPRPIHLALVWHMHQPSYRDPANGQLALPWVRLHATRAYFDMAWLLEQHPAISATFNLVPVLVEQLEAYVDGERDRYWALSRKPARTLTTAERAFVLRHFFSVPVATDIRPRARYWRLHQRQRDGRRQPNDFSVDDLRDLQVLFNLAWFGFGARAEYPLIGQLEKKGHGFTEDEKRKLLDLQIAVLRRLLPLYRRLAERGQIELTTTPYYHPILPLLIDSDSAARCQPGQPLPPRFAWAADARAQVRSAVEAHTRVFGAAPTGMWPAEGAVSPEAMELLVHGGLKWTATDEAQLWRSLPGQPEERDRYRPWRLATDGGHIDVVFRDRALSDLIGFTYARNPAAVAVDDLVGRLDGIRERNTRPDDDEPLLVTIALDGENPWEHYPESGRVFLEGLYGALSQRDDIVTVRVGEHLAANPPRGRLETMHSGSWIGGDYHIWIGSAVENRAWTVLGETRQFFARNAPQAAPEAVEKARRHLMQAEGSDWFWWYGDHFASENDEDFDHLFRGHLRAVYGLLDGEPPAALDRSLYPGRLRDEAVPPKALISPRFDTAASTYFDWSGAGRLDLAGPAGSMYQAAHYFGRLRYGFDLERLYLRFEPLTEGPAADLSGLTLRVHVRGRDDRVVELPLDDARSGRVQRLGPTSATPVNTAPGGDLPVLGRVHHGAVELGVRFADLDLTPGEGAGISAHLMRGRVTLDRFPQHHDLDFTVPDAGFEAEHWTV